MKEERIIVSFINQEASRIKGSLQLLTMSIDALFSSLNYMEQFSQMLGKNENYMNINNNKFDVHDDIISIYNIKETFKNIEESTRGYVQDVNEIFTKENKNEEENIKE